MLSGPISIEAVIVGRNDEYEPNWENNLFSAIAYNRKVFAGSEVDFRVAFVEWNPLPDRPFLAPRLTEAFPFVRGIVVDRAVHEKLCTAPELQLLLTFAFNAGFRTTTADFCLGTCGDIFLGSDVVRKLSEGALREKCLYRAERVSIRNDLEFPAATSQMIENPVNVVDVDTCSEPPYDKPPYTNAAGDFSMLDTATMHGIRGYDESITFARLHIDARLGWTAMSVVEECRLLGRIYHISHSTSHGTKQYRTTGRLYDHLANIPYANPTSWGLAAFDWIESGPRLYTVRLPSGKPLHPIPEAVPASVREKAARVTAELHTVRAKQQPKRPAAAVDIEADVIKDVTPALEEWGSRLDVSHGLVEVETGDKQWAYACAFRIDPEVFSDRNRWYWLSVGITVIRGAIGVALVKDGQLLQERLVTIEEGATELFVGAGESKPDYLILRNLGEPDPKSRAIVRRAQIVSAPKESGSPAIR